MRIISLPILICFLAICCCSCVSYPNLKEHTQEIENISTQELSFQDGTTAKIGFKTKKQSTKILLVRHAEKKKTGGKDPQLTEKGSQRAEQLAKLLEGMSIDKIYSSNYQRTLETAEPLLKARNLGVELYNPRKLEEFKSNIIATDQGKTILIVGHSNTTPTLANLLAGADLLQQFDESDYNNLILLEFIDPAKVKVNRLQFFTQ